MAQALRIANHRVAWNKTSHQQQKCKGSFVLISDLEIPSEPNGLQNARAHPSRKLIFGIVFIAMFMASIDNSIVASALPAIHKSLHSTINWTGWTITIYSLAMVVVLPIAGKFSDQFGRRRIFIYGIVVFTSASLLCGFATNIYVLIVFRAVQAIGGGALSPSAAGLISDHFGKDRDRAIGMFGTIAASGLLVGPLIGGVLVDLLSWRWIFFVNVPIGIVLFFVATAFVPESRLLAKVPVDFKGIGLIVTIILAANFGITALGAKHSSLLDPKFIVPEVIAIAAIIVMVRHTKRAANPLIPLRILNAKGFAAVNAENALWGVVGFGVASLIPLYAQQRYHLSTLDSSTLLTARAVGNIAIGTIAAMSLRRTGFRLPMYVGYSVVGVGIFAMSAAPHFGISPYVWLSFFGGMCGFGNGMANPASRNAGLQLAPDDVAAVTGLRQMFIYIGIIFSVAIVTAVLNRSSNPGIAQAHVFWVMTGVIFFIMIPLVRRIPEHKGNW